MKYKVLVPIVGFVTLELEAVSEKEAITKALNTADINEHEVEVEYLEEVTSTSLPLTSIEVELIEN